DDKLYGGEGVDALRGGSGQDRLVGGLGDDILIGDTEADTFLWASEDLDAGLDTIKDFNISEGDKIDLSDLFDDGAVMDDILANVVGNDIMVSIKDGDTVVQSIKLQDVVEQVQPGGGDLSQDQLNHLLNDIITVQ
ncbi:MAG TPA: hypothetical protein DCS35_06760, partial [Vibrio sp.]|nr:hypothetical protein [Vibrio sp.]